MLSIKMKSKFNILFEQIMHQINESGSMFDDCVKIKRENITPTIKKIDEEIFIPLGLSHDLWTAEIGSAAAGGKKDYSGDLDIAVNFSAIDENGDANAARKKIDEFLKSKGLVTRQVAALISVRFPIQGSQLENDEYVQVDLFNAKNLRFTEFKMHSPRQENSKYKGVHRFALLASLVKAVSLAVDDDAVDKNKYTAPDGRVYPAYRFKQLSILDDGVFQVTKSFKGKSGRFIKQPQKDPTKTKLVTTVPQELLDMLFGKNKYKLEDLDSFESIWNGILFDPGFPYPDKRDEIIVALWHSIDDMKDVEMPEELQDYVEEHNLI